MWSLNSPMSRRLASFVIPERAADAACPAYRPAVAACVLFAVDVAAMLTATACGEELVGRVPALIPTLYDGGQGKGDPTVDLAIVFAAILTYLAVKGRYSNRTPFWSEMRFVVCASFCGTAAVLFLGLRLGDVAARVPAMIALLLFPTVGSLANYLARRGLVRADVWVLPVVVVGNGPSAAVAKAALESDRSLGYRVVGRVDPSAIMATQASPSLRTLLLRFGARRLLIALDGDTDLQRRVIDCALRERVPFAVMPPMHTVPASVREFICFFSHDAILLTVRDGLSQPVGRVVKSTMDVSIAAALLLLTSPLFLLIALASCLDGGPALFAHRRVGAGGRPFQCLKFRTMVVDSDRVLAEALERDPALAAEWEARRKLSNDPRITQLGRFLRNTSLDELPQLINVLRRQMSLVGPRPIVESEVPLYGDGIVQYYATRPGLTGLWQVSGRSETSYARRVQLDVWYVNNWTIWHDIAVLLKTVPAVLGRVGAQ